MQRKITCKMKEPAIPTFCIAR